MYIINVNHDPCNQINLSIKKKRPFEQRNSAPEAKTFLSDVRQPEVRPFPFLYKFVVTKLLLSFVSLIENSQRRLGQKLPPNNAKSPLPVDVRCSKTLYA